MDDMVVRTGMRQRLFYSLLASSAVFGLISLTNAIAPQPTVTDELHAEISLNSLNGIDTTIDKRTNSTKAKSLFFGGLALTSGLLSIQFASAKPKTLSTPVLDDVAHPETPTKMADLPDEVHQHQGEIVLDKLTAMIDEHPWLDEVTDLSDSDYNDLVVIIGQPGKGKSYLAHSIQLLRKIRYRCPIYAFDPHADKNLRKGALAGCSNIIGLTSEMSGNVAGDYGGMQYKAAFQKAMGEIVRQLDTHEEPMISYVIDELREYAKHGFTGGDLQAIYDQYSEYRKRGDKCIYLWHSDTKSGSGLHKLKGDHGAYLTDILDFATVINFNAVPGDGRSDRRKKSFDGRAMFKPRNTPYSQANMELITIPKFCQPQVIINELRGAAEYFDIRTSGYRDPGLYQRRSTIKKRLKENLMGHDANGQPNIKSVLEELLNNPMIQYQEHVLNQGDMPQQLTDGFTIEGLPSSGRI
ncbi:hypothetical protein [Okeania sp. SIO2G5]|uniref:hypothetical protein n=1 Tax=Okeania sp. SIO2G5 TaxID=2607796 RepID=UPI0013BF4353|nr:hypothetical protein [Okeania sp. SIO2G5]NEP76028.1 hypothetical protein [Okeania sp. SIO2G5]